MRLRIFSDSMGVGQGASSPSEGWAYRFGRKLDMPLVNHGLSGSGAFEASKQGFIASGKQREAGIYACMAGFNDLNVGNSFSAKTITKIQGCHRAFLANAFLSCSVPASDASVTKSGTWVDIPSSMFAKAEIGLGGKGKYTVTPGSQISWSFSGTSLVVGVYNSDGIVQHVQNMNVSVDGGTHYYNGEGCADGINNGLDDERLTHEAVVFQGLSAGSHTVTVNTTGASTPLYVDYFGTLADPGTCQPVLIAEPPYLTSGGLAITRPRSQQASIAILQTLNEFSDYPWRFVRVNDWYDAACDAYTDGIHPNDYGHKKIAKAFHMSYKSL